MVQQAARMTTDKLGPLALSILSAATIARLRDDADELAELVQAMRRPIPIMPADPRERECALFVQIMRERDRCRRLLALFRL
jgi:hypothetical protein